jgi:hypothetical protein
MRCFPTPEWTYCAGRGQGSQHGSEDYRPSSWATGRARCLERPRLASAGRPPRHQVQIGPGEGLPGSLTSRNSMHPSRTARQLSEDYETAIRDVGLAQCSVVVRASPDSLSTVGQQLRSPRPVILLDPTKGLKTSKPLFERGDGGPQIISARRQRYSEDRIRVLRRVKHVSPLLLRGNVVVKKQGALIEIADQCCDP